MKAKLTKEYMERIGKEIERGETWEDLYGPGKMKCKECKEDVVAFCINEFGVCQDCEDRLKQKIGIKEYRKLLREARINDILVE